MQNKFILFLFVGILSSCSSLSSLNFWSDDSEENITTPAELVAFQETVSVNVAWKKSFKASNDLGSFIFLSNLDKISEILRFAISLL